MLEKRKYGLIGKNINYSFSKKYFNDKFLKENITNCSYENYDLQSIKDFKNIIKDDAIKGLNVTIPYKEEIIELVNKIDPIAKKIGAINTIKIHDKDIIEGYNTDYIGFVMSLKNIISNQKKALVLGTGGASKAIIFGLNSIGVKSTIVSRDKREGVISYSELSKKVIEENTIIINCTPLGTFPEVKECPKIPFEFLSSNHICYDLIYNPEKTKFLLESEKMGATIINGKKMLENQANESWKIWNS
ncbi:shikimate dehydrogenase [Flavobacteriaceae bacterium]|nr:shikimate dehydrogenase [Flavobacteriaceae bacterium]MDB0069070.1 shikimate dehydrogenase [Flavobacteriaceae bacterium]MDB4093230.1 shikimate dehydrogenase [Flavobacteriaceae bacterium]MDB9994725.1 shikimate dehydrogenase [Flavobacteriaceae bacterium]|tara:strand:+ start:16572 stop:17309 length:738 start_codon:yes stop_codon:yes gene_type:complete